MQFFIQFCEPNPYFNYISIVQCALKLKFYHLSAKKSKRYKIVLASQWKINTKIFDDLSIKFLWLENFIGININYEETFSHLKIFSGNRREKRQNFGISWNESKNKREWETIFLLYHTIQTKQNANVPNKFWNFMVFYMYLSCSAVNEENSKLLWVKWNNEMLPPHNKITKGC